jgi:hypothetical protein
VDPARPQAEAPDDASLWADSAGPSDSSDSSGPSDTSDSSDTSAELWPAWFRAHLSNTTLESAAHIVHRIVAQCLVLDPERRLPARQQLLVAT